MNESLVQWTLLNNLNILKRYLKYNISKKVGQELTTDYGRVDFILENITGNYLLVELETVMNKTKLNYCCNQILNYKNIKFQKPTDYCILFASETNTAIKTELKHFCIDNDILDKTYPLTDVKKLYLKTVEKLSKTFGLALPQPKNYTICYLRWLNKIIKPFNDFFKSELNFNEIYTPFSGKTNFNCYLKLATDFEMIETDGIYYKITGYGKKYLDNLNPLVAKTINISSVDLTNEQRRLLLTILTNGIWTTHKVNIYWFLKFIEITNGNWLPKRKNFDKSKLELVNSLFGVNYKSRSMYEFLNFVCNWCIELGLVEKINSTAYYERIYLTPLGIEISGIFNLDIGLKRNRLNLNFKYL